MSMRSMIKTLRNLAIALSLTTSLFAILLDPAGAYIGSPGANSTSWSGQTIYFAGATDYGTTFAWTFGDGGTSSLQNPAHTYATAGPYLVTLKVTGNGYRASTVQITLNIVAPVSIGSLTASSTNIRSGTNSTLNWTTSNATSLNLSGVGAVTGTSQVVNPTATTTYVLTAANAGGSVTRSVTVNVYTVSVAISPGSANLLLGESRSFNATVTPANQGVTWSATGGSINSAGTYTGTTSGAFTVTAQSLEDPTKTASAPVTVASVSVGVPTPSNGSVNAGSSLQFAASASGAANTGVNWSTSGGGSISGGGLFTATTAGTFTVTATSAADTTKSASTSVTVNSVVSGVTINPTSATLKAGEGTTFTASASGVGGNNAAVTWSATGGTISNGAYTAPIAAGTYTVIATSVQDTSKSASAPVTVSSIGVGTPTPTNSSVNAGSTLQFATLVSGAANTSVTWSVSGGGSISGSGLYSATIAGTFTVTATSVADTTKSASTPVIVNSVVTDVTINPTSASLKAGEATTFTASASGMGGNNTAVTWSATGGTISNGSYTAPIAAGNYTVTATSVQDTSKSASAPVAVSSVAISSTTPANSSVSVGSQLQFNATVSGAANPAINWSVSGGGTINSSGIFSATTVGGPYTVTATSAVNGSVSSSTSVTVNSLGVNLAGPPTSILFGGSATLTPSFSAGSGVLNPGNFAVTNGTGVVVGPLTSTTTYTLSVTNGGYTTSAGATVSVSSVTVSTPSAPSSTVNVGSQLQFSATVNGATDRTVVWSVSGGGTINGSGLFSATTVGGPYTVTATSAVNGTVSSNTPVTVNSLGVNLAGPPTPILYGGSATLTPSFAAGSGVLNPGNRAVTSGTGVVVGPLTSSTTYTLTVANGGYNTSVDARVNVALVTVSTPSPANSAVSAGSQLQFSATVDGAVNTSINWSVSGGGTIDSAGLFSATTSGTYTVTATSVANGVSSSTGVTVNAVVTGLSVSPITASLKVGESLSFTATVSGLGGVGQAVTWSASSGTIASDGTFTAPAQPGSITITATSPLDPTKSGTATVTVKGWVLKLTKDIVYVGTKEVAEVSPTGVSITMVDHLGSPRFIWDGTNTPTKQKFLPFGESLATPADATKFAKGFTNHEQTDPSGLIYMQARFYAPWYGRFLSPDPKRDEHFEDTQGWNIYSYCENNPTMRIDPDGMDWWDSAKGVVNGWTNSNFGIKPFAEVNNHDYRAGVLAGDTTALLQGVSEMKIGGAAAAGGGGVTVLSGGALAEVGVPVAVGGLVVAGHGALVSTNAGLNIKTDLASLMAGKPGGNSTTAPAPTPAPTPAPPTLKPGQKVGGGGGPISPTVKHSSRKKALDAAQAGTAKGKAPVQHPAQNGQPRHFHEVDAKGKLKPTHHDYN